MQTSAITAADLASSVIAVPPLCRGADLSIDAGENRKLIAHLEEGGVKTLLYGGNANLYNIAVSEYASLLGLLAEAAAADTLVVPSVGPFYGNILDQAAILKGAGFPAAMVLPTLFPAKPAGVATAVRHFAERSGVQAVLYMKDEAYITPELAAGLVADGAVAWIKYAVVREDPACDDLLRALLERVDPALVVSGIGEQPAITHLRDFGIGGFTSGCVCVAPSRSMEMLRALQAGEIAGAEAVRSRFEALEDLRNAHGPIPVLHAAVALAGIAETGPPLPLLAPLPEELEAPVREAAKALAHFEKGAH